MPGCTAPNCRNSSQKGFKLYHFPSDKERNSIWVQNCGRERGWKPTKHTCVCEVHFEESQFESHRADGLRKLKPNAIPTIFNGVAPLRRYTRRPKKESNNENVQPITKENEDIWKQPADTEFKITSQQEETVVKESTEMDGDKPIEGEDEALKEPDHTGPKFILKEERDQNRLDKNVTLEVGEVYVNVSVPPQCASTFKSSVRGRKRGRPPSKREKKDDAGEWKPEKFRTNRRRKCGRPPGSTNKSRGSLSSPVRKSAKVSFRNRELLSEIDKGTVKENSAETKTGELDNEEKSQCFVCGKNVDNGVSLHTLTNTTKVYMHHKLDKIITGEMELLIEEEGILCTRCANLLNYVDRIEVELNILNKAILNCIRKKYGMGVKISDKGRENLLPNIEENEQEHTGGLMNLDLQSSSKEGTNWPEYEDDGVVSSDSIRNDPQSTDDTNEEHEFPPTDEIQCRVCRFRTSYKSLMIFHLRQHLKDTYWCDFCNVALPERATSWVERDDPCHIITNIDLHDEHVIAEMQNEVIQEEEVTNDNVIGGANGTDTNILPNSTDLMISVMPVSAKGVDKVVFSVPQKDAVESDSQGRIEIGGETIKFSNKPRMDLISNRRKHIRVLNELGMIITEEAGTGKDSETIESEESTNSQFPYQTIDCSTIDRTVEPQTLDDKCNKSLVDSKGNTLQELVLNVKQTKSRQLRVLNEMGMIEVTPLDESAEQLLIDNLRDDANEMRVNVTPGMLTYSNNDRRLNAPLADNSSEIDEAFGM